MSVLGEIGQENVRVNITWASLSQSHMSALASRRSVHTTHHTLHTAPAPARVFIEESIDVKKSQIEIVIKIGQTDGYFIPLLEILKDPKFDKY